MANFIGATVYRINSADLNTPVYMGYNPTNVTLRAVKSTDVVLAGPGNTRGYGIIQQNPTGLVVDQTQYFVIETVQALITAAG